MKALMVAVHPDDETLSCGGTLLHHKENGDKVYWLIITGLKESSIVASKDIIKRQKEISLVEKLYGFDQTFQLNYPTTSLDNIPIGDIVGAISDVFNEVEPDVVYLPNRSDVHTDHQIAFNAAYSCTKNFRYPFIKRVLMGETISETDFAAPFPDKAFIPNVFVDISKYFEKKIQIMKVYGSEIMEDNLPRSLSAIEAMNRLRGSRIGSKYAEAFMLLYEKL